MSPLAWLAYGVTIRMCVIQTGYKQLVRDRKHISWGCNQSWHMLCKRWRSRHHHFWVVHRVTARPSCHEYRRPQLKHSMHQLLPLLNRALLLNAQASLAPLHMTMWQRTCPQRRSAENQNQNSIVTVKCMICPCHSLHHGACSCPRAIHRRRNPLLDWGLLAFGTSRGCGSMKSSQNPHQQSTTVDHRGSTFNSLQHIISGVMLHTKQQRVVLL